jgi:hypothetical protein
MRLYAESDKIRDMKRLKLIMQIQKIVPQCLFLKLVVL